jgi:Uma2 family endonuclease
LEGVEVWYNHGGECQVQEEQAMSTATLEPTTTTKTATAASPLNGEALYEVVNGQRVELPPMTILAAMTASEIYGSLHHYCRTSKAGRAVSEGLFVLDPAEKLRRRPDVAFVSKERWPLDRPLPSSGDWEVVPDLAIEVISPNDLFEEVLAKKNEYFRYSVREVWIVSPLHRQVLIHETPGRCRSLGVNDELSSVKLLPGFSQPLADVFPAYSPVAATSGP